MHVLECRKRAKPELRPTEGRLSGEYGRLKVKRRHTRATLESRYRDPDKVTVARKRPRLPLTGTGLRPYRPCIRHADPKVAAREPRRFAVDPRTVDDGVEHGDITVFREKLLYFRGGCWLVSTFDAYWAVNCAANSCPACI